MKRSDMVKVIENRLIKTFGRNSQNIKLAELILDEIEEEGMLPPGYVDETIWDRVNSNFAVFNEWEDEDESR